MCCTQAQCGVDLSIYTTVYLVGGNNTQGSITGRPLVSCMNNGHPPYFLKAAFAKIFIVEKRL